nr:hypothetical protein [Tanacetum cinerariifolium]
MLFVSILMENAKYDCEEFTDVVMRIGPLITIKFIFPNHFHVGTVDNKVVINIELNNGRIRSRCYSLSTFPYRLIIGIEDYYFLERLDKPTHGILDITAEGIFLYKSPNQAFQLLEDKVLFNLDWSIKTQNEHRQKYVAFADGSNSKNDNSQLMGKMEALYIKIDSRLQSLKEELQDIRNKYNELREETASKNHLNDDTPMCERHEANYIQSRGYQIQNSQDSYSYQFYYDRNDSEKSLTELKNEVKNDLKDFKRCIHSMRTDYDKPYDKDNRKTIGVLPKKKSKTVNQKPQSKIDPEKSITKFSNSQRVTSMFVKDNTNDVILKMKQNEKNYQTIFKIMERKTDEWSNFQHVYLEHTDRADPPLPPLQAQTENVNA